MNREPISGRAAGVAFLAIGLGLISLAALLQKLESDFRATAVLAEATVTRTRLREKQGTNQRERVEYVFTVAGLEYRGRDDVSSTARPAPVAGDTVEIVYAPNDPSRSELAADREGPPWILYAVGILCGVIGVVGVRQKPPRELA